MLPGRIDHEREFGGGLPDDIQRRRVAGSSGLRHPLA